MERKIVLSHYDYDKKETVVDGETDIRTIAKAIDPEQLGELLCDFANSYSNSSKSGTLAGKVIASNHRTLQGCVVNLMIAALCEIASDYTDARNETAVATCRFIKEAVRTEKIKTQPFI